MVEGGKRDAPIPASGDVAEGLREEPLPAHIGGRRPLVGARVAGLETAEGEGIWRRRCMSLMYSGSKLRADPNRLTNELEVDTYLDGVG